MHPRALLYAVLLVKTAAGRRRRSSPSLADDAVLMKLCKLQRAKTPEAR